MDKNYIFCPSVCQHLQLNFCQQMQKNDISVYEKTPTNPFKFAAMHK